MREAVETDAKLLVDADGFARLLAYSTIEGVVAQRKAMSEYRRFRRAAEGA